MKKIILFTLLFSATLSHLAVAQFEGRKFISGSLNVAFSNYNPDQLKATSGYSYGVDLNLGKFKTNTRASGWNLTSSLSGGKERLYSNNEEIVEDGLRGFSVGAGHFWQYYKHFGSKFGIYGGPEVNVIYAYAKQLNLGSENITKQTSKSGTASLTLSGGVYYALNERWWLLGSLDFGPLAGVQYTREEFKNDLTINNYHSDKLSYGFQPNITFPTLGLGLRYFFKD